MYSSYQSRHKHWSAGNDLQILSSSYSAFCIYLFNYLFDYLLTTGGQEKNGPFSAPARNRTTAVQSVAYSLNKVHCAKLCTGFGWWKLVNEGNAGSVRGIVPWCRTAPTLNSRCIGAWMCVCRLPVNYVSAWASGGG